MQEYIIGRRESILLHYGTVLQPFTGVMTFVMIFTNKVVSQFVLLHHIAAVATVLQRFAGRLRDKRWS